MKFCPKCGNQINADEKICPECGYSPLKNNLKEQHSLTSAQGNSQVKIDDTKLYRIGWSMPDIAFCVIAITVLLMIPFGPLICLLGILLYPILEKNCVIVNVYDPKEKIIVKKADWRAYRKRHGIRLYRQLFPPKNK